MLAVRVQRPDVLPRDIAESVWQFVLRQRVSKNQRDVDAHSSFEGVFQRLWNGVRRYRLCGTTTTSDEVTHTTTDVGPHSITDDIAYESAHASTNVGTNAATYDITHKSSVASTHQDPQPRASIFTNFPHVHSDGYPVRSNHPFSDHRTHVCAHSRANQCTDVESQRRRGGRRKRTERAWRLGYNILALHVGTGCTRRNRYHPRRCCHWHGAALAEWKTVCEPIEGSTIGLEISKQKRTRRSRPLQRGPSLERMGQGKHAKRAI